MKIEDTTKPSALFFAQYYDDSNRKTTLLSRCFGVLASQSVNLTPREASFESNVIQSLFSVNNLVLIGEHLFLLAMTKLTQLLKPSSLTQPNMGQRLNTVICRL
jgi:hypothetical protein